jgi:putative redox protein
MITTMGIKAADMGIELKGVVIDVKKYMAADPRRISKIDVVLTFPEGFGLTEKDMLILKRTGEHCPVIKSLHPDIEVNISYINDRITATA